MKEFIRIVAYDKDGSIYDIYEHLLSVRKNGDLGRATQNAIEMAIFHARENRKVELYTIQE